jgi:hypothetical protein
VVNIVDDVPKAVASDRSVAAVEIDSSADRPRYFRQHGRPVRRAGPVAAGSGETGDQCALDKI